MTRLDPCERQRMKEADEYWESPQDRAERLRKRQERLDAAEYHADEMFDKRRDERE